MTLWTSLVWEKKVFLTPLHLSKGFSCHVQNLFHKKKSEGKNDLLLVLTRLTCHLPLLENKIKQGGASYFLVLSK